MPDSANDPDVGADIESGKRQYLTVLLTTWTVSGVKKPRPYLNNAWRCSASSFTSSFAPRRTRIVSLSCPVIQQLNSSVLQPEKRRGATAASSTLLHYQHTTRLAQLPDRPGAAQRGCDILQSLIFRPDHQGGITFEESSQSITIDRGHFIVSRRRDSIIVTANLGWLVNLPSCRLKPNRGASRCEHPVTSTATNSSLYTRHCDWSKRSVQRL